MDNQQFIFEWLEANNRMIALAGNTVREMKSLSYKRRCDDILSFMETQGLERTLQLYSSRVDQLASMMASFKKTGEYPVCDGSLMVSREAYNTTLLYSYLFAVNRYEILDFFIDYLAALSKFPRGSIAAIGVGTGYELKEASRILDGWTISGFELDSESIVYAKQLLAHYRTADVIAIRERFPLDDHDEASPAFDSIVMLEILEHLPAPESALRNLHRSLLPSGTCLLTMAINIPQEDHVYHYRSIQECRDQIINSGFTIVKELYSPAAILPFKEETRSRFASGNFSCIVEKS